MNYVPFNVKTDYSFLSSLVTVKKLVEKCIEYNIKTIAITDLNSMSSCIEFYNECINNDIKPILGVDLEIDDFNILLYAKNNEGYTELTKLVTLKSERDLTISDLENSNNIIVILTGNNYTKYDDIVKIYKDTYLGYLTLSERKKYEQITKMLVFVQEVLFLNEEDGKYLGYVNLIKNQKRINEYEMFPKYNCLLENIDIPIIDKNNMINIAESCNVVFKFNESLLPIYDNTQDMDKYLTDMCYKGLNKRLDGKVSKEYIDRLNYELDVIKSMGFTNYFLIVLDYIRYAKREGILVGPGRGSAASSLVSYCLGIIDIDPIKYDLLFERFLNPGRVTMPDIDCDFEDERRDDVIRYCIEKYGIKNVAGIITFQTMGAKAAIRDVGRVFDTPIKLIEGMANFITNPKMSIAEVYSNNEKFRYYIKYNNLGNIYDIASHIEGIKRQKSVHASGVVMSKIELDKIMPLVKHDNSYITGYSAGFLEDMGLLKMDFLGITNLTLIKRLINHIREYDDPNFSFNTIPLEDDKTIELFKKADTLGIFQFESDGMKNFLRKLKPDSLEDLICANALFRPGPSMFIDKYISLKQNNKVEYIDDSLEEILKPTYGIIVYQEQILKIAQKLAGYTLSEADILRSAMSKKKYDVLEQEKPKFINGSIKNGYSKKVAETVFDNILKFSSYGFNRAHSVAYSIVAFKMAYIKTHYPKYFYLELLNNAHSKIKDYIYECKKHNIEVLKPNINISLDRFTICNNNIIYPLIGIKGIGSNVAMFIIDERKKGLFTSYTDFVARCYSSVVDRKVIENLIDSGALDIFNYNRKTLLLNLDLVINYSNLIKEINKEFVDEPIIDIVEEAEADEILDREFNVYGFYFGNHPVVKYKNDRYIDIKDLNKYLDKNVLVVGLIDNVKEITTKRKDKMAFIKISDETSSIDLTLFPNIYMKFNNIKKGNIILVQAKVERRYENYQLIVNDLKILK